MIPPPQERLLELVEREVYPSIHALEVERQRPTPPRPKKEEHDERSK